MASSMIRKSLMAIRLSSSTAGIRNSYRFQTFKPPPCATYSHSIFHDVNNISNRRLFCATVKPTQKKTETTTDSSASSSASASTTTAKNIPEEAKSDSPTTTTTTKEVASKEGATETQDTNTAKVPDVPSTSLGLFEEADAKDPNKWKKFAWKYVSAVLLFFVAYKTLHWYVDKVKEEGKKRREQLEEDKLVAEEIREKPTPGLQQPPQQQIQPPIPIQIQPQVQAQPTSPLLNVAQLEQLEQQQHQRQQDELNEYLEKLSNESMVSGSSSELDELHAFKKELEQTKQKYIENLKNIEVHDEKHTELQNRLNDVNAEIDGLVEDIKTLEKKPKKIK